MAVTRGSSWLLKIELLPHISSCAFAMKGKGRAPLKIMTISWQKLLHIINGTLLVVAFATV